MLGPMRTVSSSKISTSEKPTRAHIHSLTHSLTHSFTCTHTLTHSQRIFPKKDFWSVSSPTLHTLTVGLRVANNTVDAVKVKLFF